MQSTKNQSKNILANLKADRDFAELGKRYVAQYPDLNAPLPITVNSNMGLERFVHKLNNVKNRVLTRFYCSTLSISALSEMFLSIDIISVIAIFISGSSR